MSSRLLVLAALGIVSAPALAQAPLTLREAIEIAAARHETSREAAARVARAQAELDEIEAELLPSVTLSGTYTRRGRETSRVVDGERFLIQRHDALRGLAAVDVELFDPTTRPGVRRFERLLEAERLEAGELERSLAHDVAAAFFAVLSAEALQEASDRRVALAESTLSDARARFEVGLAARNEVTRSDLELASAQLAATTARTAVRAARLALGSLMGSTEAETRPLAEPPDPLTGTVLHAEQATAPETLVDAAVEARPDLRALEQRREAARFAERQARAERLPSVGLTGAWTATNEEGLSGEPYDWNVAAGLSWTVWDGGARTARAAAREADLREIESVADRARRETSIEVRTALTDIETAGEAVRQAEVREAVARENAAEVRELFAQGLATALEQADANVSEFEAAAERARQRFVLRLAEIALLRAVGAWPQGTGP